MTATFAAPGRPVPARTGAGPGRGTTTPTTAARAAVVDQLPARPVVGQPGGALSAAGRSLHVPRPLPLGSLPLAVRRAEGLIRPAAPPADAAGALAALARINDRTRRLLAGQQQASGPDNQRG